MSVLIYLPVITIADKWVVASHISAERCIERCAPRRSPRAGPRVRTRPIGRKSVALEQHRAHQRSANAQLRIMLNRYPLFPRHNSAKASTVPPSELFANAATRRRLDLRDAERKGSDATGTRAQSHPFRLNLNPSDRSSIRSSDYLFYGSGLRLGAHTRGADSIVALRRRSTCRGF